MQVYCRPVLDEGHLDCPVNSGLLPTHVALDCEESVRYCLIYLDFDVGKLVDQFYFVVMNFYFFDHFSIDRSVADCDFLSSGRDFSHF